jgi:transcriptional regulator with XRE-family HTH domain
MTAITYVQSDASIAEVLGQRLKAVRLERDQTQEHLAVALGVSIPTYIAAESGKMKLSLLIAALRHLGLLENFNLLLPEESLSPILQVKLQGKARQRASAQKTLSKRTHLTSYVKPIADVKTALTVARTGRVQERFAPYTLIDGNTGNTANNKNAMPSTHDKAHKDNQEW